MMMAKSVLVPLPTSLISLLFLSPPLTTLSNCSLWSDSLFSLPHRPLLSMAASSSSSSPTTRVSVPIASSFTHFHYLHYASIASSASALFVSHTCCLLFLHRVSRLPMSMSFNSSKLTRFLYIAISVSRKCSSAHLLSCCYLFLRKKRLGFHLLRKLGHCSITAYEEFSPLSLRSSLLHSTNLSFLGLTYNTVHQKIQLHIIWRLLFLLNLLSLEKYNSYFLL